MTSFDRRAAHGKHLVLHGFRFRCMAAPFQHRKALCEKRVQALAAQTAESLPCLYKQSVRFRRIELFPAPAGGGPSWKLIRLSFRMPCLRWQHVVAQNSSRIFIFSFRPFASLYLSAVITEYSLFVFAVIRRG